MGRCCYMCCRERPNEQFSGKGIHSRVCKRCRRTNTKKQIQVTLASAEIYSFLEQKNISKKNIKRLESLEQLEDEEFQSLRALILAIARAHPRRKKRWRTIRQNHRDLWAACVARHLVEDWWDELEDLELRQRDLEEQDLMAELNLQLGAYLTAEPIAVEKVATELCEVPF